MYTNEYLVGIDIGGTNIRLAATDKNFKITAQKAILTEELTKSGDTVLALINLIKDFIGNIKGDVLSVSIGSPSTLNRERTIIISTPNVTGFDYVPIVELLERQLGLPVFIEKDSCMHLYYDLYMHKIPKDGVILGFYMGTGIGNAIMIDGKILLGKNGSAAELGHIPSLGKNLPCSCGNFGCMEEYVGGKALVRLCNKYFTGIEISDIFTKHITDERIIHFVEDMAVPIATEINIFDPDYIIIGGGVIAMRDFPIDLLEKNIRKYSRKSYPESNLIITYSKNFIFSGALGATIYGSHMLSQNQVFTVLSV